MAFSILIKAFFSSSSFSIEIAKQNYFYPLIQLIFHQILFKVYTSNFNAGSLTHSRYSISVFQKYILRFPFINAKRPDITRFHEIIVQ